jgi:ABC-type amino acid transport substrate-binding protein
MLIGVSPDYPPFESVDIVRDTIIGFDIELISIICEINQWSFEIIPTPFDNLLTELQSGGLDIAISAMTITPEREVLISFSEPYYLTGQALVLIVGDSTVAELEDLRGKRVGVVSGTTGAELARETDGALVFPYDNIKTALSELSEGNLEVVINDQGVSRALLKDYPNLWVATNMLNSEYYGMAMRSDDSVRLEKLDHALAGILGGYTYERLHDRWFDYPLLDLAVPDSIQALWPSE